MKTLFKNLVRVGFASSLLLGAACGDDGGDDGDTGGECGGHGQPACPADGDTFSLPEGADIRIEYYQVSPDAADDLAGMQAIFWRDQVPDVRKFEGTPIGPEGSGCTDLRGQAVFDSGFSDEAQAVADSRTYFSVGGATFTPESTGTAFAVNEAESVIDFSATLTHGVAATTDTWGFDKKASAPPVAADVPLGDWYGVEIGGSDEMASIDFSKAFVASGGGQDNDLAFKGVYLPAAFNMTQPAEADFYAQTITGRGAYTLQWDVSNEAADAPDVLPFVTIMNAETGKGEFMCIVPQEGELTIPAEIMAEAPASGMMLFGIFAHVAWEQDAHAQHTLGVTCKFAEYTIEEEQQ